MTDGERLADDQPVVMVDDNPAEVQLAEICYGLSKRRRPFRSFLAVSHFFAHLDRVKIQEAPMPALVLLDINMPDQSGFELLRQVRDDPAFSDVPGFVILTNSCNPADRKKARQLGAQGFLEKPADVLSYVRLFEELL